MDVAAYLERINYHGPIGLTEECLRGMHRQHMLTVPFENLDIHLGRTIVLDENAFFLKIVGARRGGFCYELNGLFAALLGNIGFDVTRLSARVAHADGSFGQEFDHLVLLVRIGGEDWIADVGFGDSFLDPLCMNGEEDPQDGSVYMIEAPGEQRLLMRFENGGWKQQYLFTLRPRRLEEFAGMCHYHQTSPKSSFPRKRICTRATPDGRITLSELMLIEIGPHGRLETVLPSEEAYLEALERHFGVRLENPVWKLSADPAGFA